MLGQCSKEQRELAGGRRLRQAGYGCVDVAHPLLAALAASSKTQSCERVEHSTANAPGARVAASAPLGPCQIERDASSSATIETTASAPSHASRGVANARAPCAMSCSERVDVRLNTRSS